MAGKGGGAWKVAYADFVTAMMAFFLVMWITAQSKSVKQAISQYFSNPSGSSTMPSGVSRKTAGGTTMFPTNRAGDAPYVRGGKGAKGKGDGATDIKLNQTADADSEETRTRQPNLFIQHQGNRSLMGATIRFAEGTTELDTWSRERLKAVVPMFLGKPNKLEIRGHATRVLTGPNDAPADAWQTCYARCIATMKYLQELGIEPERMRLAQAGTFEPSSDRPEAEWQAQNARVEVYMLGEFIEDVKPGQRKPRRGAVAATSSVEAEPSVTKD